MKLQIELGSYAVHIAVIVRLPSATQLVYITVKHCVLNNVVTHYLCTHVGIYVL